MLAFMFYDVVLAVHILAVVIAFGVVFAYPLIDATMKRSGPAALPALHQLHLVLATRLIQPAMTIVLTQAELADLHLVSHAGSAEPGAH